MGGKVSLRVQQIDVDVETKTQDNVFVIFQVSIQYKVLEEHDDLIHGNTDNVFKAFYALSDPAHQLRSYVFNNVRAQIPNYILDDVFLAKEAIAKSLKGDLECEMNQFGYTIVQTLVTDIQPDSSVKHAMNAINAAARQRVAAVDKAEAEKIQVVKAAEADAESKRLSGVGLAEQRKAVINGLKESIMEFSVTNKDISQQEVMELLLLNQYFDTMKEMAGHSKSTTIFVPHTPNSVKMYGDQIREGVMQAGVALKDDVAHATAAVASSSSSRPSRHHPLPPAQSDLPW
eukprot:NODE_590_length_1277_cov_333.334691_g425_i0.p1 GENE.NODE_590_length_1277_cov_333.334691_g425_i0~~NODE_590_length_1277_cov_333.334691_g425_i0.p1  ORF type:complete len:295 (-),score=124.73 NODE_590_length_1277_cov_333.334691_g425_i0:391-1254(-)